MRNLFRVLSLLCLFCCAISPLAAEKADNLPKPTGCIADNAGVLSADAKTKMEALCAELHAKTQAQVFVVTVKTLDGRSSELFAIDLMQAWGLGKQFADRDVLLLFATDDRKYRFQRSGGLRGVLSDQELGGIGRSVVGDLEAGNFNAAISTALAYTARAIADGTAYLDTMSAVAPDVAAVQTRPNPNPNVNMKLRWAILLSILACLGGLLIWLVKAVGNRPVNPRNQYHGGGGFGGGGGAGGSW